jgi:hypothetical protein
MDDPRHLELNALEPFLEAVRVRGIRHVVLRTILETRPRSLSGHRVEVGPQSWVELAAYQGGLLVTARLDGAVEEQILPELHSRGLEVRTTSGNVG